MPIEPNIFNKLKKININKMKYQIKDNLMKLTNLKNK